MNSNFLLDTRDTFDDQIIAGKRTGLVETTNVDLAGEWNSEWFRAEYTCKRGMVIFMCM